MISFGEQHWERITCPADVKYIPPKNSTPCDENPTPLQEQIERLATNGRGYLPLQDALKIVNRSKPKLKLIDVIRYGVLPINFFSLPSDFLRETEETNPYFENHCGEMMLGKPVKIHYTPIQYTLLEELRSAQRRKERQNYKIPENSFWQYPGLHNPAPRAHQWDPFLTCHYCFSD